MVFGVGLVVITFVFLVPGWLNFEFTGDSFLVWGWYNTVCWRLLCLIVVCVCVFLVVWMFCG